MREIIGARILSPARIKMKVNGVEMEQQVSIDVFNRQAFSLETGEFLDWSDELFQYFDRVTQLPDDFFEASEDIYEKAEQAYTEHKQMMEQAGEFDAGSTTD